MKKINRLLFILAIVLTAFIGAKNVNADTIFSPQATCGDFPKDGDALITNCTSSGDEADLFDVTIMTWYKGDLNSSSNNAPGEPVGTTGVYESGYKYYLELKFKPKDGNEFDNYVNFNILGLSPGTVMVAAPNGEYIVIFEYTVHHIVHFETYGGTHIDDIVEDEWCSFDINAVDTPVKDGYTFIGWYLDPDFEDQYYGWCIDESMTFYAKYVSTANVIKNINVTLEAPIAGTVVTSEMVTDPEWGAVYDEQDPTPVATVEPGLHYNIDYTFWVKGLCDLQNEVELCYEKFEGTMVEDEYYYAEIGIALDENYAMNADDLTIKVNGQDPDEFFAVYDNAYTHFIAKIKAKTINTKITADKTSINFGYSLPGLENDDYLALAKTVKITNNGVTTVTLDIENPASQGFGCNWFDSDQELAPGESMEIGLIPHPSYIFSKDPGTYNGTYKITAKNVEDPTDTYTVDIAAKIVLLDSDISKATVTGVTNKVYTGSSIGQPVVVTTGGLRLTLNRDYKVSYVNNKNIGTAQVNIVGIGKFTGNITKVFYILPKKVSIYKPVAGVKKVTIKYKKSTGNVKYQIAYKLKTSKTWKFVTTTKTSYTKTKLKSKKYYNIKVRAYKVVSGKTYYGAWSTMKTVKIK